MPRPFAEATIEIDAPLARVWRVMLDVARYPDWNPFIVRVVPAAEPVAVGTWLALHVRFAGGAKTVSREQVSRLEPPATDAAGRSVALLEYRFGGPLHSLYLVRGARTQALVQERGGPTRYHTREEFRGLLTRFVPLASVRDGFERHARALKQRAEALTD